MKMTTLLAIAAGILSGIVSSVVLARVTEGRRRTESPAEAPSVGLSANLPPPSGDSPGASTAAHLARHQAAIDAHWREPLNPSWAKEVEASFARGLSIVKESTNSEFDRVDCRSKTCVADIHFPSYDAELRTFMRYLIYGYGRRCGKDLYGPVPEDRSAPYTVTLVFDCSSESDAPPVRRP